MLGKYLLVFQEKRNRRGRCFKERLLTLGQRNYEYLNQWRATGALNSLKKKVLGITIDGSINFEQLFSIKFSRCRQPYTEGETTNQRRNRLFNAHTPSNYLNTETFGLSCAYTAQDIILIYGHNKIKLTSKFKRKVLQ